MMQSILEMFNTTSGVSSTLGYITIWAGCIYAAFMKSGIGAALIMAFLAIPVSLIGAILTILVLDKVVFKLAQKSLMDKLIMYLLVPAYFFAISLTVYTIHNSVKYQGQEVFTTLVVVLISPLCLLLGSLMIFGGVRIAMSLSKPFRESMDNFLR